MKRRVTRSPREANFIVAIVAVYPRWRFPMHNRRNPMAPG
jgi:hypothetical protein